MQEHSCCGTDCKVCGCFGNICRGCNESKGKVFHCQEEIACAIYECCVTLHQYKDCSSCDDVPCAIWHNTKDPKYTEQELIVFNEEKEQNYYRAFRIVR